MKYIAPLAHAAGISMEETAAAIVATGEAAKYIIPHCGRNMFLDENLLLKGLKLIYEKNQK